MIRCHVLHCRWCVSASIGEIQFWMHDAWYTWGLSWVICYISFLHLPSTMAIASLRFPMNQFSSLPAHSCENYTLLPLSLSHCHCHFHDVYSQEAPRYIMSPITSTITPVEQKYSSTLEDKMPMNSSKISDIPKTPGMNSKKSWWEHLNWMKRSWVGELKLLELLLRRGLEEWIWWSFSLPLLPLLLLITRLKCNNWNWIDSWLVGWLVG